jgi:hypothetical protein
MAYLEEHFIDTELQEPETVVPEGDHYFCRDPESNCVGAPRCRQRGMIRTAANFSLIKRRFFHPPTNEVVSIYRMVYQNFRSPSFIPVESCGVFN